MVTKRKIGAKPVILLMTLFLLGTATGVLGTLAFVHDREASSLRAGPRAFEERRMRGIARRLDLDDDQREQVRALIAKSREEGRAISRKMMDDCGEPLRQQHEQFQSDMKKLLRPEQAARFEELQKVRRIGPLGEMPPPPPFP